MKKKVIKEIKKNYREKNFLLLKNKEQLLKALKTNQIINKLSKKKISAVKTIIQKIKGWWQFNDTNKLKLYCLIKEVEKLKKRKLIIKTIIQNFRKQLILNEKKIAIKILKKRENKKKNPIKIQLNKSTKNLQILHTESSPYNTFWDDKNLTKHGSDNTYPFVKISSIFKGKSVSKNDNKISNFLSLKLSDRIDKKTIYCLKEKLETVDNNQNFKKLDKLDFEINPQTGISIIKETAKYLDPEFVYEFIELGGSFEDELVEVSKSLRYILFKKLNAAEMVNQQKFGCAIPINAESLKEYFNKAFLRIAS